MSYSVHERSVVAALMRAPSGTQREARQALVVLGRERTFASSSFGAALSQPGAQEQVERDLEAMEALGGRLVCPGDDEWPGGLDDLEHAKNREADGGVPLGLWVRGGGHLRTLAERSLSIVGSRASTDYGTYVASEFAHSLALEGYCVISGAALGVDAAAHRGALLAEGRSIAVLANGVNIPYPQANEMLLSRILAEGCVISEEAPGAHPRRDRFLLRNRLIAALAPVTVLVEAGRRSGALNTARHCRRLNRHVLVVPGNVTSAMSEGGNELLRDGTAAAVMSAEDVLSELEPIAPMQLTLKIGTKRDQLSQKCRDLLDAFPRSNAVSVDELAARAKLPLAWVRAPLIEAVEGGFVEVRGEGFALTPEAKLPSGGAPT